jgi:preprotein translocase subunit SecD
MLTRRPGRKNGRVGVLLPVAVAIAAALPAAATAPPRFGIYALERDAPPPAATRAPLERRYPRARLAYCPHDVCATGRWYAFVRRPEVLGSQILRSTIRVERDPNTGSPIVVFRFTPGGQQAFHSVTGLIANRGRRAHRPEHVAFVLEDRVLAAPFVDYRRNPNGLVGGNGVQIAARTRARAERIAARLRAAAAG